MTTYNQLVGSSLTDLVVPFTSDNSLGEVDTGTRQLSGYTLEDTKFTFSAILSALDNTYIGASFNKLIWDMGDGTTQTGVEVTKQYKYPGIYTISTIITDQNGVTHRNRITQQIKVYNYVPDAIIWYTDAIADTRGGRPEQAMASRPSNDLTIYRTNSWQSWDMVKDDDGYYINLYSSGSKSAPLTTEQYWSDPDIHLTPTWRFIKNKASTEPITRVKTSNEYIYVKRVGTELKQVPGETTGSVFVGTSGVATVNYIDDNPNRLTSARSTTLDENTGGVAMVNENNQASGTEDRDIILYASFDTSKFPVIKDDHNITEFELLKSKYIQIYETQKVGLPLKVKYNYPAQLTITSNGINDFPISSTKFLDSPMSICVRTADISGINIVSRDIPELKSRWTAPTQAFSGGDTSTDTLTSEGYVTLFLSGADSKFSRVKTPFASEEDFKVWDVGSIYPEDEANKYIRIVLARRDGTLSPELTNRTIKIIFSELVESQQDELKLTDMSDHVYPGGRPRDWMTRDGARYYGYVAPRSTYKSDYSLSLELNDEEIEISAHGALLTYSNISVPHPKLIEDKRYRYFAHTLIDPPLTFNTEVIYYYITNPSNDWFWQIKPVYYREYSYGDDGSTQTYTPPISTRTPGNSGLYGMSVDPDGNVLAVDGDTDKIIRYWRNGESRSELSIRELVSEDVRVNHYPDNPDQYGYSPSSICLDKNLDYWITLYDTVSTIKVSGETDEIVAVAVPPVSNVLIHPRQSVENPYGRQGEYGENLIIPATVDTCINNDIVVTYTNPLCSFIARYDTNGTLLFKYELPSNDRYFVGDVVVDVSDHIWAITESTGLDRDGNVDLSPLRSMIYSFDESLTIRHVISSVQGTSFYDTLRPPPAPSEEIAHIVNMQQQYDFTRQEYYETGILIDGFGEELNPVLTLFEGNLYHFQNQYFNNGKHPLRFQELGGADQYAPDDTPPVEFAIDGNLITHNVSGMDTEMLSIKIDSKHPARFLLIDENNIETIKLLIVVVPKPVENARDLKTFDVIDNASFIIPDNNNHIWFSWGNRYCSRFNQLTNRIDTTFAVGSAYEDDRFDPLSAHMVERRDNANRRSSIEGLSMDTANNLLVVHNYDRKLYAINSDTPTISANIEINTHQEDYDSFTWVDSICSNKLVQDDDFLLYPDTHLTKEQIQVFLNNSHFTGTQQQLNTALLNYKSDDTKWRTCHGANPVSATGFEQEICAYGDWTGYRWINKYDPRPVISDASTGFVSITGASEEFRLVSEKNIHEVFKVNEDLDFAGVMRSYMKQPSLSENTRLYNDLMDAVFGSTDSGVLSIGKRIYERITNYVDNHSDIDTCTINALHGLSEMVNYELRNLGMPMPAELQRLTDLFSINLNRLKGMRYSDQNDFDKLGNWNQQVAGGNLGCELLFIYDWNPTHGYSSNDYVYYRGEYYESIKSNKGSRPTIGETWRMWPNGHVRTSHLDHINKVYRGKSQEWRDQHYYNQSIKTKLIQNLRVDVDNKFVLHDEHADKYNLVTAVAISVEDPRIFGLKMVEESRFVLSNDDPTRFDSEYTSTAELEPIYTIDNDVVTLMNQPVTNNSTIILFRHRTYKFDIESFGHPVIITEAPGLSASQSLEYVSGQGTEFGRIVIKTEDHPTFGRIVPEKIYYQSQTNPDISGTIIIKDVVDLPGYSDEFKGLITYNLNMSVSAHAQIDKLGWGLNFPEDQNAWQYYSIYEYVPNGNLNYEYKHNIIDWDSPNTTLSFDDFENMGVSGWSGVDGFVDVLFEKKLRGGLDLFNGMDSIK